MIKARSMHCITVAFLAAAALGIMFPAAAADSPAEDMEALKIELPQQAFYVGPLDYFGPNLEQESFKKRPPFMAPKGAVNLAKGKTVTAGSAPTMGKLEQITDGEKETCEKGVVELKPGKQWVQVDLGQTSEIYAVLMWHLFAFRVVYFDVTVEVSDDPEFSKDFKAVYNNDHNDSSHMGVGLDREYFESYEGRLIDTKGVKCRYVRFYSNGNSHNPYNHYIEVEVYGRPAT